MSSSSVVLKPEKLRFFQTVLSSPGMEEKCKIQLSLSRLNILCLARIIESGLSPENEAAPDEIMAVLSGESAIELEAVKEEILKRGGLTDFYQKLKCL